MAQVVLRVTWSAETGANQTFCLPLTNLETNQPSPSKKTPALGEKEEENKRIPLNPVFPNSGSPFFSGEFQPEAAAPAAEVPCWPSKAGRGSLTGDAPILWMDEIQAPRTTLKPWLKPLLVGIYVGESSQMKKVGIYVGESNHKRKKEEQAKCYLGPPDLRG